VKTRDPKGYARREIYPQAGSVANLRPQRVAPRLPRHMRTAGRIQTRIARLGWPFSVEAMPEVTTPGGLGSS
jgi:hypothetical protein